ncbi:hypothetical protein QSE00_23055 [Arenibacter sp. M-2]|uniref:hypothetical protein n=1 Tax=Arenibacter sp. M-2 TaxID=3053612 RepID=UPI0025709362|nr:hypothetical protein [Arenibacter sp. M-2]MDL5514708.1 hypothetical protein [Arenibacter sp. M-2]
MRKYWLLSTAFILLFVSFTGHGQNNLIDPSSWTVGTGDINGFTIYGAGSENERILYDDPYGNTSVVWVAKPEGNGTSDGGVYSPYANIDPAKTYRLSIWIKKTGSQEGTTYFGLNIMDSQGQQVAQEFISNSINSNPYFFPGQDFPELDKWYLLIAYVHPNTYSGNSLAKVYDGETGQELSGLTILDFKFGPGAVRIRNRALLWGDTNVGDKQYYWNPAIYEVNGQEPTIEALLNIDVDNGGSTNVWSTNGNNINFSLGNVGIGTTDPGTWKLAVNGKIRAKEIKVETTWADYVFEDGYNLPSLEEVRRHIQEKGISSIYLLQRMLN